MVRYCLNDAIRLVVMGYVDLGRLICDRWDPRDLISHGFGYRRVLQQIGEGEHQVLAMRVEGLWGGYQ
jgi:hypothetical protein